MKISTEIQSATNILGEERALEYIAKAGFDGWDFSMYKTMCKYDKSIKGLQPNDHPLAGDNYLAFARKLKQIGLDNGIVCNQSHAPFPPANLQVRSYLKRAIECTAEAGGEYCVIHPCHRYTPEENAEFYWELLPFAKEHGVKIATENMFFFDWEKEQATPAACGTAESFVAHVDAVNDPDFGACLDIGHTNILGDAANPVDMIHALGHRIKCLHLHDNDKQWDLHRLPFTMKIDYNSVCRALKEIRYDGWVTLEAHGHLENFDESNVLEGLVEMAGTALRLAQMIENA